MTAKYPKTGVLHSRIVLIITVESDRSHDEARYRLPDNYVTLKPITDADNRCLIFVNPNNEQRDTSHYAAVAAPFYRR